MAHEVAPGDTRENERIAATGVVGLTWRGVSLLDCDVIWVDVADVRSEGSRLIECAVLDPVVERWAADESTWRQVRVADGRIGSLLLTGARVDDATLSGMRIGYLDLRSAAVTDLVVSNSRIDTLDLTGGQLTRATFRDCLIGEVLISHARLAEVDLRGAEIGHLEGVSGLRGTTIGSDQLLALAPLLAEALGVVVSDE